MKGAFLEPGKFLLGVNYWASHAGTRMWSDWRADEVAKDFSALATAGVTVMRVFPLWPDFQPLTALRTSGGRIVEFRFGEDPIPDTAAGRAGMSETMLERFADFTRMAGEHGLGLVVGILTGWMSGRLYMPEGIADRNAITDPAAVMWEERFVRHFVTRFRDSKAIVAWDLGNECNCMAHCSREQAYVWTATITGAIRSTDPGRPVVSGMHGLSPDPKGPWMIQDQAELTDVLTTHPYPPFTAHCDLDPLCTIRPILHATAETRMYGDIGRKPAMVEETGNLGTMFADVETAAPHLRSVLWSAWAHDCRALLWWCAFDQAHLEHAPYDWCNVERELGLLRRDRSPKPVAAALGKFGKMLESLPFGSLPPRHVDALCVLSPEQDNWGAAYLSFILAKMAGVDIEFQYGDGPLRDSPVYLLPSVGGFNNLPARRWRELKERVNKGATLYLSLGNGMVSELEPLIGLRIKTRERRTDPWAMRLLSEDQAIDQVPAEILSAGVRMVQIKGKEPPHTKIPAGGDFQMNLAPAGAKILGIEADGNPAFSRFDLGKGRVYFLSFPLELILAERPGAFHRDESPPYWRIYDQVFRDAPSTRVVRKAPPGAIAEKSFNSTHLLGVTEHARDAHSRIVVMINQSPRKDVFYFGLADGWAIGDAVHGEKPEKADKWHHVIIDANDAAVFMVEKRG